MKIYVASSWRNNRQPEVVRRLREAGHEVYDFRHPHLGPGKGSNGFHWSEIDKDWTTWTPQEFREGLEHDLAKEGFRSDFVGMDWADACVCVLPCGKSAHLEMGWMLGASKLGVFLVESQEEPELMYKMADHVCISIEEILDILNDHLSA